MVVPFVILLLTVGPVPLDFIYLALNVCSVLLPAPNVLPPVCAWSASRSFIFLELTVNNVVFLCRIAFSAMMKMVWYVRAAEWVSMWILELAHHVHIPV